MSAPERKMSRDKTPPPKDRNSAKDGDKKKEEEAPKGGMSGSVKLAIAVAVLAVVGFGLKKTVLEKVDMKEQLENAITFIEKQGAAAIWWYCLFTFIGVVCLIPTTPMELAGGFLFSPQHGMWMVLVYTGTAKLCANIISVLMARFVVRDWVMKNIVAKSSLLQMVLAGAKDEPWKMCFLVRGSMVPLAVKNYGLGVTEISYLPIAVCSTIFTNFYAFQNIYVGSSMSDLKEVFAPKKAAEGPTDWQTYAKKGFPILFNLLLILLMVKAVQGQVKKQAAKVKAEEEAKEAKKAK